MEKNWKPKIQLFKMEFDFFLVSWKIDSETRIRNFNKSLPTY